MEKIHIIEYQNNLKDDFIELYMEFGEYLKKLDEGHLNLIIKPQNYGKVFYKITMDDVKNKNGKILALMDEEKMVGVIVGVIIKVGEKPEELDCKAHIMGRVSDLFISEKYRGLGFGSKLMEKMEKYFKENNCYKVNIEVFGLNTNAFEFYKGKGFQVRNMDMVKVF